MYLRLFFLLVFGMSAGGIVAAGVFAFLAIIGVFPRVIGKTGTRVHIVLYENMIIAGGIVGNILDLYEIPILFGAAEAGGFWLGTGALLLFGVGSGIFVGCLVMSLAETLKALPVLSRRLRLAVGLQYVILAVALGKGAGSLAYFLFRIGV